MNEGTILNHSDIEDLRQLAQSLEQCLAEVGNNDKLEDAFKLRRKFRGTLGELIALVKLHEQCGPGCRYMWYGGGKRGFDLLIKNGHNRVKIEVKSKRSGGCWHGDARHWMEFEEGNDDLQIVKRKIPLSDPNRVYVFADVGTSGEQDKFYVLPKAQVQNLRCAGYKQFLKRHGHKRPRNPNSYHSGLEPKELEPYRDNWNLIIEQLNLDRRKPLTE